MKEFEIRYSPIHAKKLDVDETIELWRKLTGCAVSVKKEGATVFFIIGDKINDEASRWLQGSLFKEGTEEN